MKVVEGRREGEEGLKRGRSSPRAGLLLLAPAPVFMCEGLSGAHDKSLILHGPSGLGRARQLAAVYTEGYTEGFLKGVAIPMMDGYSGDLLVPEGIQAEASWLPSSNVEEEIKRTGAGWTR